MSPKICALALLLAVLATCPAHAQSAVPPAASTADPQTTKPKTADALDGLAKELNSNSPSDIDKAIDQLKDVMRTSPQLVINGDDPAIMARLIALGRFADIDSLLVLAIQNKAADAVPLTTFQTARVRNFLRAKQCSRALEEAKANFNITPMAGTSDAILLVIEALHEAYPNDATLADRFKTEQIAGAAETAKPVQQTVLKGIKIDGSEYADLIKSLTRQDFATLSRRGNLLLLSDRPQEAQQAFEEAYEMATDKQLAVASESLARVMRAEDGSIARANAFVLSLRPKAEPVTTQPTASN
jgi:hypothetical protein